MKITHIINEKKGHQTEHLNDYRERHEQCYTSKFDTYVEMEKFLERNILLS